MSWGLLIANRAKRGLRRLSLNDRTQIDSIFFEMRADPFSGDVKILKGTDGTVRRRVGDLRIIFELDRRRKIIMVLAIKSRASRTY